MTYVYHFYASRINKILLTTVATCDGIVSSPYPITTKEVYDDVKNTINTDVENSTIVIHSLSLLHVIEDEESQEDEEVEYLDDRVLRGGSWFYNARNARSAYRYRLDPSNRFGTLGFRLAVMVKS